MQNPEYCGSRNSFKDTIRLMLLMYKLEYTADPKPLILQHKLFS